ncbi:ABC transporter ATP-binding protein [Brevibacillus massiliensis]|jgi:putative spermidine/putrescine transport system ATP-binding protein|uniref:ABC transporter ATP-binding protein n=1 Tax=Brevibacillus massiliensis TaxID=1118054 RepID=UPI0002E69439|nr:ABC transporter ATP-binding protein [Brevibacillus massiliensis]
MGYVELSNLDKYYKQNQVVKDLTLSVEKGEFLTLLGPSGCGKTTTLRIVAGLEEADRGTVWIAGKDVTAIPASERNIGMVFQSYALFPNLSALENIMFGLEMKRVPKERARQRAMELVERVGLAGQERKLPDQLSGGQQQRVALARALAVEPQVLLLDEPLSALDAKIRESLRDLLKELQRDLGVTTIFVTHDQDEALALSDRIAVMDAGRIIQLDTPYQVYRNPVNRFAAEFIGTFNFLSGTADVNGTIRFGASVLHTAHPVTPGPVTVGVRPESIKLADGQQTGNLLEGRIAAIKLHGSIIRLQCRVEEAELSVDLLNDQASDGLGVGDSVQLFVKEADLVPIE